MTFLDWIDYEAANETLSHMSTLRKVLLGAGADPTISTPEDYGGYEKSTLETAIHNKMMVSRSPSAVEYSNAKCSRVR